MRPNVYKSSGIREGKGFTFSEIIEAGLSQDDVLALSLHFDRRRKTTHPSNIELLRKMKEEAGKAIMAKPAIDEEVKAPEVPEEKLAPKKKAEKPKAKKEVKPKEKKAKKKEEKAAEKKGKGVPLTELKGVGKKKAEEFAKSGVKDVEDLLSCDPKKVSKKTSFTEEYIAKLKEEAEKL